MLNITIGEGQLKLPSRFLTPGTPTLLARANVLQARLDRSSKGRGVAVFGADADGESPAPASLSGSFSASPSRVLTSEDAEPEAQPGTTELRALRELFDFDVRKSSAAFVTRSVLVRLEIVLPSYDVDATRFDAILVLALAESCDAEADIAFRNCFSSSLLHSQTHEKSAA